MPGTIKCKVGDNCVAKANDVLFCVEGEFLCWDTQGKKIVHDFIKTKRGGKVVGYSNDTKAVAAKKVDNTLYAYVSCCAKILQTSNSNVPGYLTLAQHHQYRKDAKHTGGLHSNGFLA